MQFTLSEGMVKNSLYFHILHLHETFLSLFINQIFLNTATAILLPDLAKMQASIKVHYVFTSAFLCLLHSSKENPAIKFFWTPLSTKTWQALHRKCVESLPLRLPNTVSLLPCPAPPVPSFPLIFSLSCKILRRNHGIIQYLWSPAQ